MTEKFDLVVIGSGPAGEKGAAQAAYYGKKVAVIDKAGRAGGAPVFNAGIPSKTLRETALYITGFRSRDVYGISLDIKPKFALEHLRRRAGEVVQTMESVVAQNLARHQVDFIPGSAAFRKDKTVEVDTPKGKRVLEGEAILIATGSRPFHPPGLDFEDPAIDDSESILSMDQAFESIVVIGGGAVGSEYASIMGALGLDVTLTDMADRLVPFMDAEISKELATCFENIGMRLVLGQGSATISRDDKGLRVEMGTGEEIRPDKVLFAAGRSGNIEGLGLEELGIELDPRGRIIVDDRYETNVRGIFAAGDVIGPPALASVSMEQGRVAVCHAFGIPFKQKVDPVPPFGVYSIPEAAAAGLTEEEANAKGLEVETGRARFANNTRASITGLTDGMLKLVFDPTDLRLHGVHILGDMASELIHLGQSVIHNAGTIDEFIEATYNVPTRTEIYKYAAYDGLGRRQQSAQSE
jgi:NAD(P) transhydrogenase